MRRKLLPPTPVAVPPALPAPVPAARLPRPAVTSALALTMLPKASVTAVKMTSLTATSGEASPTLLPTIGGTDLPGSAIRRRFGPRRGLTFRPFDALRLLHPLGAFVAFRR